MGLKITCLFYTRHLLILFGGLQGLESCLASDQNLQVNDIRLLVHYYLNTCPLQGSRTIRTEVCAI